MKKLFALWGMMLCLVGQGSEGDEAARAALRQTIDAQNQAYLQALLDGDAHAFASLFSEDGCTMVPGAPILKGRRNILAERHADFKRIQVTQAHMETDTLDFSGDLAYEIGRFRFTLAAFGKKDRVVSGKFLVVWKRQADGEWKIQVDAGLPD